MKISIISLLLLEMFISSCHRHTAITRLPCCAKDNGAIMLSPLDPSVNNNGSIYQLPGKWTDQNKRRLSLEELQGKVVLVAMIFTHCGYACPRLVDDMKTIEAAIPAAERNKVDFALVSFDSERDTPGQLSRFANQKQLDNHWELLHGYADQVRELSMLLNVQYEKLPDGDFSHSNAILVLDQQGVMVQSLDGLGSHTEMAVRTINQLINR